MTSNERFGEQIPFCEPYWYQVLSVCVLSYHQGYPSPYYTQAHKDFRAKVRTFVEVEIQPHIEDWIAAGAYPLDLHEKAYKAGIQGIGYPREFGGTPPEKYDSFYELIAIDEIARVGGGAVLGKALTSHPHPDQVKMVLIAWPFLRLCVTDLTT
jgi:hypothetical protein